MMRVACPLVLLLGVSSGANACLIKDAQYSCTPGSTKIDLSGCGITDTNIDDLTDCFIFAGQGLVQEVILDDNELTGLPYDFFDGLRALERVDLSANELVTLPQELFASNANLKELVMFNNKINALPPGVFRDLVDLELLELEDNELTTLPFGLFSDLDSLQLLTLFGNDDLQCLPTLSDSVELVLPTDFDPTDLSNICGCPAEGVDCFEGLFCFPGADGWSCRR